MLRTGGGAAAGQNANSNSNNNLVEIIDCIRLKEKLLVVMEQCSCNLEILLKNVALGKYPKWRDDGVDIVWNTIAKVVYYWLPLC